MANPRWSTPWPSPTAISRSSALNRSSAAGSPRRKTFPATTTSSFLSEGLWRRRYAADPNILGHRIRYSNSDVTIVGVMPADFRFPQTKADLWTPIALDRARLVRSGRYLITVARLKPGATISTAQADMNVLSAQLQKERPDFNSKWGITVVGLREQAIGDVRTPLLVLLGAVGLVLSDRLRQCRQSHADASRRPRTASSPFESRWERAVCASRASFWSKVVLLASIGVALGSSSACGRPGFSPPPFPIPSPTPISKPFTSMRPFSSSPPQCRSLPAFSLASPPPSKLEKSTCRSL